MFFSKSNDSKSTMQTMNPTLQGFILPAMLGFYISELICQIAKIFDSSENHTHHNKP